MEVTLHLLAHRAALVLEAIAILVILIGGVDAVIRTVSPVVRARTSQGSRRAAWLSMARWLVLGLEFMLAADIARTVVDPSWEDLGKLAATALIRTFLNFFLERDLEISARSREAS